MHARRRCWKGLLLYLGCAAALIRTLSAPSEVRAQFRTEGTEVTVFVGGLAFQSWGLDDTAVYGVRYAYAIAERYALQGSLGVGFPSFSGRVVEERTGEPRTVWNQDARVFLYHGSFVYGFRKVSLFTPYTMMGAGWISRHISEGSEGELSFHFGGGVRIPLRASRGTPPACPYLALEIRQFVSSIDVGGFWPSSGRVFVNPSGAKRTVEISAGLVFPL